MSAAICLDGQTWFVNLPEHVEGGLKPASHIGAGWFPFAYELENVQGVGLATGAASPGEVLTLNLGLTGPHRLHVAHNPAIRVWLDGDTGYCELPGDASAVRDVALPVADLTGRRLHLQPVRGPNRNRELTLFYIRAEPCPNVKPGRRNLIVTNDGHGVFWQGMDTARDLYRHLYPFRNSDVFRVIWGLYGGLPLTLRPGSRFNDLALRDESIAYDEGNVRFYRSLRRLVEAGEDPLAVVRRATIEYGLELHYYVRMSAFYGPFPHVGWTTRFFRDHPELRCITEQGQPVNIMSYAFASVQDYVLSFFEEILDYEPEGLCLAFNRGLPLMICEAPVLEAFKHRHGRDAKLPDDCDSAEMLAIRHELLTNFVIRVKQLCDRRGKALSCIVPRDFEHNRFYGLDIEQMLNRGLFESVMIGAGHGDNPALNAELQPVRALKSHGAKIFSGGSSVRPHGQAWVPNDLRARAQHMANILDAGLDGGWFWDAEFVFGLDAQTHCRFGDRAFLNSVIDGSMPPRTDHKTRRIHDLVVGRYNPWHAY